MSRSTSLSLRVLAVAAALFALTLPGCRLLRVGTRSMGPLFDSPRAVPNKLTRPLDPDARLAVLWIGHATALVQIDDKVILTDPVFTPTVGQVSKRLVEPGLDPENLPPIDAVLVSHLHFDHLSLGSLSMIEQKVRMLLMPPGGVTYLTDFAFPVLELRRFQAWEKDGLRVTAAPVSHLGWRYGVDAAWMKESFTGYVVEHDGLKVYFGGDTAYEQSLFAQTGVRFPGIDVALLPIAPIEPRDFMRHVHMDPAEALQAFFDLGARTMVPIHYDTFVNSADEPGDALAALDTAKTRWSLGERQVTPLAIGERRAFVKKGERPTPIDRDARPAPAPPGPSPAPSPDPSSEIPDDDRLD